MQTNGGVLTPILEVNCQQFGPFIGGLVDFSGMRVAPLTNAYGVLQIMAIGLMLWDVWHAQKLSCMVVPEKYAAWKHENQNNIEKGGDLGIEPRSQYLLSTLFTNCATESF